MVVSNAAPLRPVDNTFRMQPDSAAAPNDGGQADNDFLGLVAEGPTDSAERRRFRFDVLPHLSRLDGQLYGGTAIAVSIAAAEIVTQRPALWMTTQFVATAPGGSTVDVSMEVLAGGHRTAQVRVSGVDASGAVMFASLGATGRFKHGAIDGRFESCPVVSDPQDSQPVRSPFEYLAAQRGVDLSSFPIPEHTGFVTAVDYRIPTVTAHPDDGPGRICVWARRRDRAPISGAIIAYLADMVPMSVANAGNRLGGGVSLDNTIRLGDVPRTEWVLIDLRPHLAVGGYGHGAAQIWSDDRRLVATASQTATMLTFDPPPEYP